MSGASGIFILDIKGKIIISRSYRGEMNNNINISERFIYNVIDQEDSLVKPIFTENGIIYCWIKYNNIYILGTCMKNCNATLIIEFLYRLTELLKGYFKELEEESIRDNFVIMYELLDEIMDNGYPQITELKILREYVTNEAHELSLDILKVPTAITNAVSWRSENIKHKKNEIFLDVVEKLNLLVSSNGNVLRSEIIGTLRMKSFLSGMPELKLGLNDKLLFENIGKIVSKSKSVEIEDIKFHQCVRLSRFENDRTISFIPPDGEFELMSYRLSTNNIKPLIWVDASVNILSASHMEWLIKVRSQYKSRSIGNNIEICIPVPCDVDTPLFKCSVGICKYTPDRDEMIWYIKQLPGQKDYVMTANYGLPSVADQSRNNYNKRPITVKFEIPYFTVSGITVRYLKIIEKTGYQALPWVRYITQNGDYQLRMT